MSARRETRLRLCHALPAFSSEVGNEIEAASESSDLQSFMQAARFPKGNKELSVSLFQTAVLMLFNDADAVSFEVGGHKSFKC